MNIAPARTALIERTWDALRPRDKRDYLAGNRGKLLAAMPVSAVPELPVYTRGNETSYDVEIEPIEYRREVTPNRVLVVSSGSVVVHREPYDPRSYS